MTKHTDTDICTENFSSDFSQLLALWFYSNCKPKISKFELDLGQGKEKIWSNLFFDPRATYLPSFIKTEKKWDRKK